MRRFALTTMPKRACGSKVIGEYLRAHSAKRAAAPGLSQARAYTVARTFHGLETN